MFRKRAIALVLGAVLILIGTAFSEANDRKCDERIAKAEQNLQQAIAQFGENSSVVQQRRQELRRERHSCGVEGPAPQAASRESRDPKKSP